MVRRTRGPVMKRTSFTLVRFNGQEFFQSESSALASATQGLNLQPCAVKFFIFILWLPFGCASTHLAAVRENFEYARKWFNDIIADTSRHFSARGTLWGDSMDYPASLWDMTWVIIWMVEEKIEKIYNSSYNSCVIHLLQAEKKQRSREKKPCRALGALARIIPYSVNCCYSTYCFRIRVQDCTRLYNLPALYCITYSPDRNLRGGKEFSLHIILLKDLIIKARRIVLHILYRVGHHDDPCPILLVWR